MPDLDPVRLQLFRDVLQRFGRVRLCVSGTSMLPTLWPGDVVVVHRVDEAILQRGDVLLLQRGHRLFCHRLVRWVEHDGRRHLCTRGDFLSSDDPLFPPDNLLGRVELPHRRALASLVAPLLRAMARISQRPIAWLVRRRAVLDLQV